MLLVLEGDRVPGPDKARVHEEEIAYPKAYPPRFPANCLAHSLLQVFLVDASGSGKTSMSGSAPGRLVLSDFVERIT